MNPIARAVFRKALDVHQFLYEHSGGRIGQQLAGTTNLLLRTTGAKTGQPRTAALTYSRDGERYMVVASNGGAPKPPAWFVNVRAKPEVEIQLGTRSSAARAEIITSEHPDYSRLWRLVNDGNAGRYDEYQSATERSIPLVALTEI